MGTVPVTAEAAKTEIESLMAHVSYHKSESRRHRREAGKIMAEIEDVRRKYAEELGFEVVIVPQAHSQEAKSNVHHPRT